MQPRQSTLRHWQLMRRCVLRALKAGLAKGFLGWVAMAAARREAPRRLRKGAASLINDGVAGGFAAWAARAAELRAIAERQRAGIGPGVVERPSFVPDWAGGLFDRITGAEQTSAAMVKGLGSLRHRDLSRGWRKLCEVRSALCQLRSALRSLVHRGKFKAWNQ